jgi:hypothetical protein
MPLHTPSSWTFWLSVALVLLAIISRFGHLPYLGPYAGWVWSRGLPHSGVRLHRQDEVESSYSLFDGLMDGAAVMHDIVMSAYELLEWRIDVVEINIGDEAIDAGIYAGGFLAMQIAARGN